jgi:hypothetical protein
VVSCEAEFTASVEAKVAPLAIAIFLRYSSDPVITALSQAGAGLRSRPFRIGTGSGFDLESSVADPGCLSRMRIVPYRIQIHIK